MALNEQHVAFKFAGGVETKMDSKAVPSARLLGLENGIFSRAISIAKRNGYDLVPRAIDGSTSLITGAKRLAARDDELLLFTSTRCYSKQSQIEQWSDAGALIAPLGHDRPAVHTSTAQTTPDHATANGVTVYAWEDSLGGVYWTAVDATSGRVFRAPTQANATGQRPRCVPVGDVIHVYYAVPTQRQINVIIVNTATPSAAVTERIVVTDLDTTNPVYDACPTTRASTPAAMVWHEHATSNFRVGYVTAGGDLGAPGNGNPSAGRAGNAALATAGVGISYAYVDGANGDILSVVYAQPADGLCSRLQGGTTAIPVGTTFTENVVYFGATSITRVTVTTDATMAWCVFEEAAAQSSQKRCVINSVTLLSGVVGTARTLRSVGIGARAFMAGTDTFGIFVHDTTYFNTYLTLRLSDFAPAGRHLPASAAAPSRTHVPAVYVTASVATVALPYKSRLESTNNDKFTETAIRKVTLDFDSEDSHQTAQIGAGLYLAAACPQHYDGYTWTEQGFHVGPEYVPTAVAGGGSLTTASTYQYKVWYEWTDKQGEIHRGPESIGISVSTGASTQCTLTLPTLRVTRKDNVRICAARSLPGDTSRLWRVTSLDPTTSGAVNGYVANSTSTDSVSFIDRMSDVDLQLQEQVYTVGGILSNDPSPLGSHVVAGRNRLFFTDAEDGCVVRFSQRRATGFALEIAPELQHDVDPMGGDITALAVMDDVIYVFKASAIFAFNGDGPYETGVSTSANLVSGFSSSQIITTDVGCTDPSSIVLTPQGLMFKSTKGIYIISRSREVSYIGAPVEAYNDQNVRRATVLPDRDAVLFLTDSGKSLYFDYLFQQWSTFTNHEGYDAAVVDNTYHYLRTNNVVFRETPGEYSDGGSRITLRFETAWLHVHEHLQGLQRFWKLLLLGTWSSPHQLAVSHRMSYDEAWSEPYYLDATGALGPPVENVYATGQLTDVGGGGPAPTSVNIRSLLPGTQGNNTVVQITAGLMPDFPTTMTSDTPTLVQISINTTVDGITDTTWEDVIALLNTSANVTVTSSSATGTMTAADAQTITLAGGVDAYGSNDYYGWITGDSANTIGEDPILGTDYGEGNYGDGVYGGTGPDVYQWRYGIHEDGQSIQFRFEDFEKAGLAGASFELTEMTIVGGVKKPDVRPFSGSRST